MELIARYGIPLEGDIEVTIPIEIAFGAGHTRITVKGWESHNVTPGGGVTRKRKRTPPES